MRKLLKLFEAPGVGGYAGVPTATTSNRVPKMASDADVKVAPNLSSGKPASSGKPVVNKPAAPNYKSAVKSANAAFVANQAKAPQGDQTAGGKTNADFLPGAAGGARPDAIAGADSSGYNAQSQSQKTPAATDTRGAAAMASRSATTPATQTNALGIAPQANVPSPFGPAPTPDKPNTPAPAVSQASTSRALPITTSGGPTAANPTSVNPPTQGGPAVTGGFGQETNISRDSDDVIAKRTPYGQQNQATKSYDSFGDFASAIGNKVKSTFGAGNPPAAPAVAPAPAVDSGSNAAAAMASKSTTPAPEPETTPPPPPPVTMEEELEEELNELMRLSGRPMQEKAPPTAKGERMVKNIKQGYEKDGKLSDKEKSIAYATAWKAHNKSEVSESVMLEAGSALEHIIKKFKHETKNFLAGNDLDSDLYDALYDYYSDNGEMPYGVAKARDGDPYQWVGNRFADEMQMHGYNRQSDMFSGDRELTELARLAGLSESQVVECGDMSTGEQDSMNVSTNMSSDGKKSVNISAQGDRADALLQMLKMAGMRPHDNDNSMGMTEPEVIMIGGAPQEEMMDEEYANEPEEEYQTIDSIIHQGDDLNREKEQHPVAGFTGDNPMAEEISLDEELQSLLDSVLFREEMTDVLKAEQPYKDEKTGKMVTPPKGATMPPPDSQYPPGDKRNLKK
jgi:hypothetical protein